jgi:hypothetical protein
MLKRGQLPLEFDFVIQHELVDLLQTGEDLKETRPEPDDVLDSRGWGVGVEKMAQIPAVCILQYQSVRTMLLERSVEIDYVKRWAGVKPQQRATLSVVGGLMPVVVIDFKDKFMLGGPILSIPRGSDTSATGIGSGWSWLPRKSYLGGKFVVFGMNLDSTDAGFTSVVDVLDKVDRQDIVIGYEAVL